MEHRPPNTFQGRRWRRWRYANHKPLTARCWSQMHPRATGPVIREATTSAWRGGLTTGSRSPPGSIEPIATAGGLGNGTPLMWVPNPRAISTKRLLRGVGLAFMTRSRGLDLREREVYGVAEEPPGFRS